MKIPPVKVYFSEEDKQEIIAKINEVLSSGQLTQGKYNTEFEEKFASYIGKKYAIAVSSGTSALEISLRIFGVEGKEVIVPTNTFFATVLAVLHAGGKVKFVDIDPATFAIDFEDLKRKISKSTKGVIIVHIGGIVSPSIEAIRNFCKENDLFLLEDAAHAHGSIYNGKQAGGFGDAGCFSFFPTKVMTSGEGGMIVTDSEDLMEKAKCYRDQGKISLNQNVHDKAGYNWRMSELHAIVGLSQLARLKEFVNKRREIAKKYDEKLEAVSKIKPLFIPPEVASNYYKYIVLLDEDIDREKLKTCLREKFEIRLSGEVYELPCHLQPFFENKYPLGTFPKSEYVCAHHVCLPVYFTMTEEEINYVVAGLEKSIKTI
ncbi:MAG TPA: DegT/DnrJ/EryC1/StrS family aminotransferase [Victivallales bacterium]|nr:DegT/DnrJ/EryC1/StrS family aminotransferase [Victivallales bacterium]